VKEGESGGMLGRLGGGGHEGEVDVRRGWVGGRRGRVVGSKTWRGEGGGARRVRYGWGMCKG